MDQGTAPGQTTRPVKRRRLRACDFCRQRKIRCDNLPGSCRNCQVYSIDCRITRDEVSVPRAARLSPASISINHARPPSTVAHMPQVFSSVPEATCTVLHNPGGVHNDGQIQASHRSSPIISPAVPSTTPETLLGVVTTEVSASPKHSKFAGITSPQVLAKSIEGLVKDTAPYIDVMAFFCPTMSFAEELQMPLTRTRPLVDKIDADRCLLGYFRTYHPLFPIFDQRVLQQDYDNFYANSGDNDVPRAVCIMLVIALGSGDKAVYQPHFDAANALYTQLVAQPYMYAVQALILMTLHLINIGKDGQAYLTIGTATRISQSIGLHRSIATHVDLHEFQFVFREHHLRSCIWWTCYCLEKKLALEGGRPSIISDRDCDADLPDAASIWTPGPESLRTNTGSSSAGHSSLTSPTEFLSALTDLCKRLATISRTLFNINMSSVGEKELIDQLAAADLSLVDWRASLPVYLRSDNDLSGTHDGLADIAGGLLQCMYMNAVLVVHRASLIGGTHSIHIQNHSNSRIVQSDKICVNAARALGHATSALVHNAHDRPIPRWIHPYAINAVMTLFIGLMRSPASWSHDLDMGLMRSMRHCFRSSDDPALALRFDKLSSSLCRALETPRTPASHVPQPNTSSHDYRSLPIASFQPDQTFPSHHSSAVPTGPEPSVPRDGRSDPKQPQIDSQDTEPPAIESPESCLPASRLVYAMPEWPHQPEQDPWEQFRFSDFFGDQASSWYTQLWPVMQMEDE
ncbi:fungal-specific transcription factor domain-containing protein [Aspergillus heterothallicus]